MEQMAKLSRQEERAMEEEPDKATGKSGRNQRRESGRIG